jgi:hypothetical protein
MFMASARRSSIDGGRMSDICLVAMSLAYKYHSGGGCIVDLAVNTYSATLVADTDKSSPIGLPVFLTPALCAAFSFCCVIGSEFDDAALEPSFIPGVTKEHKNFSRNALFISLTVSGASTIFDLVKVGLKFARSASKTISSVRVTHSRLSRKFPTADNISSTSNGVIYLSAILDFYPKLLEPL